MISLSQIWEATIMAKRIVSDRIVAH